MSTSSGVSNPSTVESREASALASALPRTAPRRVAAISESTSEGVSTADSGAYAVSALPSNMFTYVFAGVGQGAKRFLLRTGLTIQSARCACGVRGQDHAAAAAGANRPV